ncbi:MAG: DUF4954 family protein [Sedimentisphaerales bacterium]|nr:DUF4954 family protein [Sedimentisphaerales bacterium]
MKSESIWQDEKYHPLSLEQIAHLQEQGCTSDDWSKVKATVDFDTDNVLSTHFGGEIRLGSFTEKVSFFGGVTKQSGISNASIHNCVVGNNVFISNIKNYIANYIIEDNVVIDNIGLLAVEGESSFGNGTEVVSINEAGGREIPIYDRLSAQIAYVLAFYRHRPEVIEKLQNMICDYARSVTSSMGYIGKDAFIINCRIIKNVKVGPAAILECVTKLENGSINSCPEDTVYIGPGVSAKDFIISSGSKISDGALLSKCFVGQGTELSKQYSAENSLFFANCEGFHGEACSIFAGPYTVTHHKSTLLIAGLFSFFNAGSGTNQSNHMYKLGPVHQGIIERGSKTGSDSYLLWPARVGAFTIVTGKHYCNCDTSDLPFSYLIENKGESVLVPGINLRNVGILRDSAKWPNRDKRKSSDKLDLINFELSGPYTVQKMLIGRELLMQLRATSGEKSEYYTYNNVKIKKISLDKGVLLYETGIYKFLGNCLINRLHDKEFKSINDLREIFKPQSDIGSGKWFDLAGLFSPEQEVKKLLCDIENDVLNTLQQTEQAFRQIYENYPLYEWSYAAYILQKISGKKIEEITPSDIIELITKCKDATISIDNQLIQDAGKEFAPDAQFGYGIDGGSDEKNADFESVRGTLEKDKFVSEIENYIKTKTEIANDLINRLKQIT